MEDKVQVIQETLDVDKESAQKALRLAEDDLKEALQMGDYIDNKYLIVHFKFEYKEYSKDYLILSLIWEAKSGDLIKSDIALSDKKEAKDIDLDVSNKAFVNALEVISSREDHKHIYYNFIKKFKEKFNPTIVFNIYKLAKEDKIGKIKVLIEEHLHNILENPLDLELAIKLMTKVQLEALYPDIFKELEEDNETDDNQNNSDNKLKMDINLNVSPVISPLKGVKATKLELGDKLLVKISDSREIGRYLGKLLSNSKGETVGIIDKIDYNSNLKRYSIVVKFGPNIYGSMIIEPEVKIINVNEENLNMDDKEKNMKNFRTKKNYIYFGLFTLIIILLGVIIMMYYY
ncbi:hypothetical protein [Halonatronum saccharophilum]|uniref:hypothetical protein n=1 Tax=Halonatronum saccharophilum TaxID=150060 RepID=UPI0004842C84|nr:hypothetical protein [Halonatronum saccharophilum]